MAVDTVIKNCKVVGPEGIDSVGVAIDGGVVVAIAPDSHLPAANKTIDAKASYVLPGIIDPHVHFGSYCTLAEAIPECQAAVCGGITTAVNTIGIGIETPPGSFAEKMNVWKEVWEKNSLFDMAFSPLISQDLHIREIPMLARQHGAATFKFMMAYKGEEAKQVHIAECNDGMLYDGFKAIADLGPPARAMIHAENMDIIMRLKAKLQAEGRTDLAAWTDARPGWCEAIDIERAVSIAKITRTPLYIVHVSSAQGVEAVRRAKSEGVDIIAETCVPYLTLTKYHPVGALGKVNPPWKDEESIEALWQAIKDGTVSCLGSDCCPRITKQMKQDIWEGNPGYDCIENCLPVMLSEGVRKGRITLEKLVEVACRNNAKAMGIYPRKGTIRIGSDADIVIVDLNKKVNLSAETLHQIGDFCIYEGWEVKGYPVLTMVRGNVVMQDGKVVGKPGVGKYVPRFVA